MKLRINTPLTCPLRALHSFILLKANQKGEHLRTTSGKWGQPGWGPRRGMLSTIRGIVLELSGCSEAHTVTSWPRLEYLELVFRRLPAPALPRLRLLHGELPWQVGLLAAGAKFCIVEALSCHRISYVDVCSKI